MFCIKHFYICIKISICYTRCYGYSETQTINRSNGFDLYMLLVYTSSPSDSIFIHDETKDLVRIYSEQT